MIVIKVFNARKIKETYNLFMEPIGLTFISTNDIIKKICYKKLKDLTKIHYAKILFRWMSKHMPENLVPMAEKFFPTKIGEIKSSGRSLSILSFSYSISDDKIHCVVCDDGNDRTFKLHTDLYGERTREYSEKMIEFFKKKFDKLHGFFLEEEPDGSKFITDRNMVGDKYNKIVVIGADGSICHNKETFGEVHDFEADILRGD